MVMERLDFPFAATRRYGAEPLTLAFDILTLPFQISNMLTGVPELEIPVFGQVAPGPTPTPTTYPTPAPAPAPTGGGGIEGTFGVVGLAGPSSGLGYQSIIVGGQTFSAVRVSWDGLVRNTGNSPLSGATIRLQAVLSQDPAYPVLREKSVALPTIAPGASASVRLAVDVLATDPPGDFAAIISLDLGPAGGGIAYVGGPGILGTIGATTGVAIEGSFGV